MAPSSPEVSKESPSRSALAAVLRQPHPTSVSADETNEFHMLLQKTIEYCTDANVERTKEWILQFVVHSPARIVALGRYLMTLSASLAEAAPEPKSLDGQINILYILSDVLHHTKCHDPPSKSYFHEWSTNLKPHLLGLFQSAGFHDRKQNKAHHKLLVDLLDIWDEAGYYGQDQINALRQVVKRAGSGKATAEEIDHKASRDVICFAAEDDSEGHAGLQMHERSMSALGDSDSGRPVTDGAHMAMIDCLCREADGFNPQDINVFDDDEGIVADIDELGRSIHKGSVEDDLYGNGLELGRHIRKRRNDPVDTYDSNDERIAGRKRAVSHGSPPNPPSQYHQQQRYSRSRSPPRRNDRPHSRSPPRHDDRRYPRSPPRRDDSHYSRSPPRHEDLRPSRSPPRGPHASYGPRGGSWGGYRGSVYRGNDYGSRGGRGGRGWPRHPRG